MVEAMSQLLMYLVMCLVFTSVMTVANILFWYSSFPLSSYMWSWTTITERSDRNNYSVLWSPACCLCGPQALSRIKWEEISGRPSHPRALPPSRKLTNGQRPHKEFVIKDSAALQSRTSLSIACLIWKDNVSLATFQIFCKCLLMFTIPEVTLHELDHHMLSQNYYFTNLGIKANL